MLAVYRELLEDRAFIYEFEKEYRKQKAKKREVVLYYLKQKLSGFALVVASVLCPMLMDGDATASVIFLPLGLFLLLTKEKVMDFKGK